jgi:hypothetical protein
VRFLDALSPSLRRARKTLARESFGDDAELFLMSSRATTGPHVARELEPIIETLARGERRARGVIPGAWVSEVVEGADVLRADLHALAQRLSRRSTPCSDWCGSAARSRSDATACASTLLAHRTRRSTAVAARGARGRDPRPVHGRESVRSVEVGPLGLLSRVKSDGWAIRSGDAGESAEGVARGGG